MNRLLLMPLSLTKRRREIYTYSCSWVSCEKEICQEEDKKVKEEDDDEAIPCRWVFRKKIDAEGKVCRYKARLVCKAFMQRADIDYCETFAPVAKFSSSNLM